MDVAGLRWLQLSDEQIADALARQAQQAQQAQQAAEDEHFGVWDENWDTWLFFLGLSTRWDYLQLTMAGPAGAAHNVLRKGLPRTEIESAARLGGWPRRAWPQLLADIEAMEQAVLRADAQRRQAGR